MAIQITILIRGLFSGFVTIGRYGEWLTDINLLLIGLLICQNVGTRHKLITHSHHVVKSYPHPKVTLILTLTLIPTLTLLSLLTLQNWTTIVKQHVS